MAWFEKKWRDLTFLISALRTLRRISHITPEAEITTPDIFEHWARKTPNAVALIGGGQKLTYGQMEAKANQYARWAQSLGLKRGDAVALLMENRPEYIVAWFGLLKIGVVVSLINTNLRSHALAHCLNISKAGHLILGEECAEHYLSAASHLESPLEVWATGRPVDSAHDLDKALRDLSPDALPKDVRAGFKAKDPCFYIYTSGTTGMPKAARLSHVRVMNIMHGFSAAANAKPADRMYIALPLYHSAGGVLAVGVTMTVGGSVILAQRFSARQFWSDCVTHKATMFQYIGEFCRYLLNADPVDGETKHNVRVCIGNGLRPDIWEAFQARFKLPKILEFYGSTEGNVALINYDCKVGAIGRVPKFLRHRYNYIVVKFDLEEERPIRTDNGLCMEADVDEPGEVLGFISEEPRERFEGYSRPEETEKKILRDVMEKGDAWFRTGDLMRKDKQGYFYFVDRIGDTFRWKGENVATSEVSEVISVFDGVLEANVYGVHIPGTDGRAGMASLVVEPTFDLKAFHAYVSAELPDYAVPLFLRLQGEIDITGTFKHRKVDLVKEGFDPVTVDDPVYFNHPDEKAYVPLDQALYDQVINGAFRF